MDSTSAAAFRLVSAGTTAYRAGHELWNKAIRAEELVQGEQELFCRSQVLECFSVYSSSALLWLY
jgi:hypothetical protein